MNGRLAQSVSTARQLSACRSTPSSNSSVEVLFIDLWLKVVTIHGAFHKYPSNYASIHLPVRSCGLSTMRQSRLYICDMSCRLEL